MSKIIFYEGTDCAGKGVLIENTKNKLIEKGYTVEVVVEPGCTLSMKETRYTLLNKNYKNMDKLNYLSRRFLYAADHAQLFSVIAFLYDEVDYILVDRHTVISDVIYGPMMTEDDEQFEKALEISGNIKKCYDIYLDMMGTSYKNDSELVYLTISNETLKDRYTKRNTERGAETDIFDEQSFDYKFKINGKYNGLAGKMKEFTDGNDFTNNMFSKIHVIDANGSPDEVLIDTLDRLNI